MYTWKMVSILKYVTLSLYVRNWMDMASSNSWLLCALQLARWDSFWCTMASHYGMRWPEVYLNGICRYVGPPMFLQDAMTSYKLHP